MALALTKVTAQIKADALNSKMAKTWVCPLDKLECNPKCYSFSPIRIRENIKHHISHWELTSSSPWCSNYSITGREV